MTTMTTTTDPIYARQADHYTTIYHYGQTEVIVNARPWRDRWGRVVSRAPRYYVRRTSHFAADYRRYIRETYEAI